MNVNRVNRRYEKRRAWRTVVTVLASIVVFVTTYALIIPAITWETTLICEIPEHTHDEGCYTDGVLTCGKEEHVHTDACFDAPQGDTIEYSCGKAEHTHTDACYDEDGTLHCSVPEHVHSLSCLRQPLLLKAVRALTATPTPSTKAADPATDGLLALFKNGSGQFSAENDGKVAVDKSVFDHDPGSNQFEVVLSALGQSYVKNIPQNEMIHPDIVFVVDISSSMNTGNGKDIDPNTPGNQTRFAAVADCLNYAIGEMMKSDPESRIGIVSYSEVIMDGTVPSGTYSTSNGTTYAYGGTGLYLPLDEYVIRSDGKYVQMTGSGNVGDENNWQYIGINPNLKNKRGTNMQAYNTRGLHGTNTQAGLLGALRMFQNARNKENREPVLILITDGEPRSANQNVDGTNSKENPGFLSGSIKKTDLFQKSWHEIGYWTIRTAIDVKKQISEMYKSAGSQNDMFFYTMGPGVTSVYGKTILDPSDDNLAQCAQSTNTSSSYNEKYLYKLLMEGQAENERNVSNSLPPLSADELRYTDFADWSLSGDLTPQELEEGMAIIIANLKQIPRPIVTEKADTHYSIIDSGSLMTFIDTLGKDMELDPDALPAITYGDDSFPAIFREAGTLGRDNKYTSEYVGCSYKLYRFAGEIRETSTHKALDLSGVLLYEIETDDGIVMLWQFPDELLPVIYHNPGTDAISGTADDTITETDPLRLHMTVRPKDGNPTPGETYYTNSTDNPATCIFTIAEDNPYYNTVSGTQENPVYTPRDRSTETDKTDNPTGTLTYSSDYNQASRKMEVLLGNNGKLTTPLSFDVQKVWADKNPEGIASVTVHLLANGADTGQSLTLSDENDWRDTFSGLPKYDNDGNEITYTVSEVVPTHYTVSGEDEPPGTFEHTVSTTTTQTVTVPAQWESATSFEEGKTYRIRIESETGNVLKNQTSGWGQSRTYSLITDTASDNTTTNGEKWTYSGGYLKNESSKYYLRVNQDVNAVRYNNNQDTTVSFIKNQNNNRGKIRLTRGNTSKYLVVDGSNLSVYSSGSDFALEVLNPEHTEEREVTTTETVSGYGFLLTNERIPLTIPVKKEWGPGTVPREITVQLYTSRTSGGIRERSTLTLNAANNWTAEFDMTEYQDRTWYVREVDSLGYFVSYNGTTESLTYNGSTFTAMKVVPGETAKVTITNEYSARLPATGGIGTPIFYVIGALLTFGALTIGYVVWRRREGRGEI